jgi:Molybdopterin guanine dinucleotide synthesis protein B
MPDSSLNPLAHAKWAFTTRHVERGDVASMLPAASAVRAGQLVLARVERLGQHDGLQLACGRRAELYVGDHVVVCLGNRYAPDQFEGLAEVGEQGACELLAGGGVAGTVRHRHGRMKPATALRVVACLGDVKSRPIDIGRYSLALPSAATLRTPQVPVLLVVGSSMNAGKTTACASLIHGLSRAGLRVGAVKVTGTGSFGDVQSYADAGAAEVLDFTDAGYASTYREDVADIENAARRLIAELERRLCDVVVVEVADGLFQRETAQLMASSVWRASLSGVLFAAADAMGAVAGVQRLRAQGWPVLAFSGLVTASPLAAAEAEAMLVSSGHAIPRLARDDLRNPAIARGLANQPHEHCLPLAA